ncbi:MAG: hypothetical protein D6773_08110 [Alphaproteobacteria bacterium]|nr:MAG: hypothetical protein D6773_08110 [Alphaproteobacteria bacterium]
MAHVNRVCQSIETEDGTLCVDIFRRPDATYGFEEYRREREDGRGWYPVGFHAHLTFESESAALAAALAQVTWLAEVCRASR